MKISAFLPITATGLVVAIFAAGCSRSAPGAAASTTKPLVIETAVVEHTTDPLPVEVSGILARQTEAVLSFKTGGVIETVTVRAGDSVKQGQMLASLRLAEIDALVAQARTGVDKARRDFARVQALHADRVATLENLQDAQSAVELAEAALRSAEFNRTHSVITAPADGRILRRTAEPDELAAPGRPVLTFASDAAGWLVRAGVPEHEVVRLHPGDHASVSFAGRAELAATVGQIAEAADPATRTVEVELRLDAPAGDGLRSGFVVDARMFPQPVAPRAAVPLAALVEGRGRQAALFLLNADARAVRRQMVEIEAIDHNRAFLRTALPTGARVATTGAEFLTDGRTVTVRDLAR
ncbi:MAG: efflux RND transporter periplasmic adaptor subunit [Opitutae bacterium]|nr:efflux RND transporter periplasmic adaptor subunit [Opitutae bacterium]